MSCRIELMFEERRICSVCGVEKPMTEYYRNKGSRGGRRRDCKACNLTAKAERHRANPAPGRERAGRWAKENRERYNERMRAYRESGKKAVANRRSHLKRTFGITLAEYDELLARQDGGCAVCGTPPRDDIALHVDHDHVTGEVRGLLCFPCNSALGRLEQSVDLAEAARDYLLEAHRARVLHRLRALKDVA
jgi:hypothetical protein